MNSIVKNSHVVSLTSKKRVIKYTILPFSSAHHRLAYKDADSPPTFLVTNELK